MSKLQIIQRFLHFVSNQMHLSNALTNVEPADDFHSDQGVQPCLSHRGFSPFLSPKSRDYVVGAFYNVWYVGW